MLDEGFNLRLFAFLFDFNLTLCDGSFGLDKTGANVGATSDDAAAE